MLLLKKTTIFVLIYLNTCCQSQMIQKLADGVYKGKPSGSIIIDNNNFIRINNDNSLNYFKIKSLSHMSKNNSDIFFSFDLKNSENDIITKGQLIISHNYKTGYNYHTIILDNKGYVMKIKKN